MPHRVGGHRLQARTSLPDSLMQSAGRTPPSAPLEVCSGLVSVFEAPLNALQLALQLRLVSVQRCQAGLQNVAALRQLPPLTLFLRYLQFSEMSFANSPEYKTSSDCNRLISCDPEGREIPSLEFAW